MSTAISKNNLDSILDRMPKRQPLDYLKLKDSQIMDCDTSMGSAVDVRIQDILNFWVRWKNGMPERIPAMDLQDAEDMGYEEECILKVQIKGKFYGIKVPKGSVHTKLMPYLRMLKSKGMHNTALVVTRITATCIKAAKFPYHILSFELVEAESLKSAA